MALERKETQESWLFFKNHFLNFQARSILTQKKSSNDGNRSARWTRRSWWNLDINPKCTESRSRDKKIQERCRTTVWGMGAFPGYVSSELAMNPNAEEVECSKCPWVEVWKAKAHLRLNTALKDNRKGSYRHIMYHVKVRDFYFCILLIQGNGQISLVKEETLDLLFLSLYFFSLASFSLCLTAKAHAWFGGNRFIPAFSWARKAADFNPVFLHSAVSPASRGHCMAEPGGKGPFC